MGDGTNTGDGGGTFTYSRTGKNTGRINLTDAVNGNVVITLTFTSTINATYILTQGAAVQRGTIVVV